MTTELNPTNWTNPYCSQPDERSKATELYEQGWSIAAIASELNRAHSTIWGWFNTSTDDYKIQEWKGKASPEEKQKAVEAYLRLRTIPKVCAELDRSYDTIRRWLHEAGIDTSKPVSKSKIKKDKSKADKKIAKLEAQVAELESRLAAMEQQLTQQGASAEVVFATFNNL